MLKEKIELLVPDELISDRIYLIRDQKVMIDRDLAKLYLVETKVLKQAVKRNLNASRKTLCLILPPGKQQF